MVPAPAVAPPLPEAGRTRRLRGLLLAVFVAATLSACTAGFVYDRVHWLVSWYVNGLVSLDDAQERQLREMVNRTMTWHRATQLPKYIGLLEELDREKDGPVTPQDFERHYRETLVWMDDFLRYVVPDASRLLATLTPEQVSELQENMAEDNEDTWEEYGGDTAEKRQKRRVRSALRVLQRFTGSLTAEQRADVGTQLATMHDVSEQWMERRRHWQARFIEILRSPPPGAGFEAALLDLAVNPNQFDPPEYRAHVEANRRVTMTMLANLVNSLDARQRERLGRKLQEFEDDLWKIVNGR